MQAAITPPAPSFPLYDDEVQGEFLWWFFLVDFDGSSIGRFILFSWYFEPQLVLFMPSRVVHRGTVV